METGGRDGPVELTTAEIKKLQPYGDMVLMRLADRVKESAGGIVMPQNLKLSTWQSGVVVKAGPGARGKDGDRRPVEIQPGQEAVYKTFERGWEFIRDSKTGETYVIMPASLVQFTKAGWIAGGRSPNGE